jgi:N utilization substance protein A
VREVLVDDEDQQATVVVPDDQLSLAIGREGQNARLAAKLTGWRVDIKSETEFSQEEEEIEIEGAEEVDGRCAAVLSAGRRCPNASLSGSRYCGLPQHQALARFDTNEVTVVSSLSDEEIATLADSDADEGAVSALVERAVAEQPAEEPEAEEPEAADAPEEPEAEERLEADAEVSAEDFAEAEEVAEEVAADEEGAEQVEPPEQPDEGEEPEGEAEEVAADEATVAATAGDEGNGEERE